MINCQYFIIKVQSYDNEHQIQYYIVSTEHYYINDIITMIIHSCIMVKVMVGYFFLLKTLEILYHAIKLLLYKYDLFVSSYLTRTSALVRLLLF